MLFKSDTLEKIKIGMVDVAFRRWKRPTVKDGGTLTTPVGMLRIKEVKQINDIEISDRDIKRAGYPNREVFLKQIGSHEGVLYRVTFKLEGEDPRIALRENDSLDESQYNDLQSKLNKMDNGKYGPWTMNTLNLIHTCPGKHAQFLAGKLGVEKDWLKTNIRKLKSLGLTISLEVGYKLSPRGKRYLALRKTM